MAPGHLPAPGRRGSSATTTTVTATVPVATDPAPAITPARGPTPRRTAAPSAWPATRPASGARASSRVRRRRKSQAGFVVLFSVVVGAMVLGLVSLNALLAQASFRVDDLSSRIAVLEGEHLVLVSEQAELSAPGRIAEWARRNGMRLPETDDIRYLHAPDASTAPAGAADHAGGGA